MENSITDLLYFYQPKVELNAYEVVGYECLLRGIRDNEVITPDKLLHTLNAANSWPDLWPLLFERLSFADHPSNMKYAINVSPDELKSGAVRTAIQSTVEAGLLNIEQFELEVTEYKNIDDYKALNMAIDEFNKLGVDVWLDDFGSGYSNFNHLRNLNVQGIKIDRSIIFGIDSSDWQKKIVESLVQFGIERNNLILAEGVESKAELETIKELGCHLAQGYFIGKPKPAKNYQRPHAESCSLTNSPARTKIALPALQVGV